MPLVPAHRSHTGHRPFRPPNLPPPTRPGLILTARKVSPPERHPDTLDYTPRRRDCLRASSTAPFEAAPYLVTPTRQRGNLDLEGARTVRRVDLVRPRRASEWTPPPNPLPGHTTPLQSPHAGRDVRRLSRGSNEPSESNSIRKKNDQISESTNALYRPK